MAIEESSRRGGGSPMAGGCGEIGGNEY